MTPRATVRVLFPVKSQDRREEEDQPQAIRSPLPSTWNFKSGAPRPGSSLFFPPSSCRLRRLQEDSDSGDGRTQYMLICPILFDNYLLNPLGLTPK